MIPERLCTLRDLARKSAIVGQALFVLPSRCVMADATYKSADATAWSSPECSPSDLYTKEMCLTPSDDGHSWFSEVRSGSTARENGPSSPSGERRKPANNDGGCVGRDRFDPLNVLANRVSLVHCCGLFLCCVPRMNATGVAFVLCFGPS